MEIHEYGCRGKSLRFYLGTLPGAVLNTSDFLF